MKNFTLEYRTNGEAVDLAGARPSIDWKGNKNMEFLLLEVGKLNIDWRDSAEKWLKGNSHLNHVPFGTRVTKLYYDFQYTTHDKSVRFAEINHCDMPDALARKMADFDKNNETIIGMWITLYATLLHPDGEEETLLIKPAESIKYEYIKLMKYYENGELIDRTPTAKSSEDKKPRGKSYPGSENIAKLINKAIRNQDWKDPYSLPLQNPEWPLRPNELATLYNLAVGDITLTIYLGQRGKPPVEEYMVLDAKDFPKKLKEKLLADDQEGLLKEIASMKIVANMTIDGEPLQMERIHTLPDEDEEAWYPPVPLKWNICSLCINWRADHYTDSEKCIYARPRTEASKKYPNIVKGKPMYLRNLTGTELFPDPIVLDYNNDELSFQYGECQYTIKPGEPFISDEKGMNYTTFVLTVTLKME